jgi:hypothetical protein
MTDLNEWAAELKKNEGSRLAKNSGRVGMLRRAAGILSL